MPKCKQLPHLSTLLKLLLLTLLLKMNAILQRFKSKTYWVAIVGALLTVIEANSGFIGQFLPAEYRAYIVMLWPVLMLVLREITTTALAAK